MSRDRSAETSGKPHRGKRRAHISTGLGPAVTRYVAETRGVDETAIALVVEGINDFVARCSFFVKGASYKLDGRLIAKQLPDSRAKAAYSILRQLRQAGFVPESPDRISVPEPFACLDGGILLMEEVEGRKFSRVSKRGESELAAQLAAQVLFKLHSSGISPPQTKDPERLTRPGRRDSLASSALTDRLEEAGEELRVRLAAYRRYAAAPIHCDFHFNQFRISDSGTVLLDTDGVSIGDPAQDVGYFLASAYTRERRLSDTRRLTASFVAEYERLAGAVVMKRVPTYEALAFVHRAWKRVGENRTNEAAQLLELAAQRLDEATPVA